MMRIDAHQHFWVYDQREYAWIDDSMASLRRHFLPDDLKPELERNGFQGSVVVQARQTLEETRWLLELATDASFIKSGSLRPWEHGMRELGTFPNVFCKLSGLVTEDDWQNWKPEHIAPYMDVAFESFGPSRLMIGSDWPVCTLAASYTSAINLVESYLSQHATELQEATLGGNALRLWKLGKTRWAKPSWTR